MIARHTSALVFIAAIVAVFAGPLGAHAAARTVAVLSPPSQSPLLAEAIMRVRGELAAAGFDVVTLPAPQGEAARSLVEDAAASHADIIAAFAIVPASGGAEIWLSDRVHGRTLVQGIGNADGERGGGVAKLAFSAVELLRTSLAELWLAPDTAAPSPAAPPEASIAAAAPPRQQAAARTAFDVFAEARTLTRADALLWGGGGRVVWQWDESWEAAVDLGVTAGSSVTSFARTSLQLGTVAATFGYRTGGHWAARLDAGMRGGVLRLVPELREPSLTDYGAITRMSAWAGPLVAVALHHERRRLRVSVGSEFGFAVIGGRGQFVDNQAPDVSSSGVWLGLRLCVGWRA